MLTVSKIAPLFGRSVGRGNPWQIVLLITLNPGPLQKVINKPIKKKLAGGLYQLLDLLVLLVC